MLTAAKNAQRKESRKNPRLRLVLTMSLILLFALLPLQLRAQQQPTALWSGNGLDDGCASGCALEFSPSQVALRLYRADISSEYTFSVTLPWAMQVDSIDGWLGSGFGETMESGTLLVIRMPSGAFREWMIEFDKHADLVGNVQRLFPVNLSLPAGTVIEVHSMRGFCPITPTQKICAGDYIWHVNGQLQ